MGSLKDRVRGMKAYLKRQRSTYEFGEKLGLWGGDSTARRMDLEADALATRADRPTSGPTTLPDTGRGDIQNNTKPQRLSNSRAHGAPNATSDDVTRFKAQELDSAKGTSLPHSRQQEKQLVGYQPSKGKTHGGKKASKIPTHKQYEVTIDDAAHDQYINNLRERSQQQWRPQGSFATWQNTTL